MGKSKQKYFVVWEGKTPGIYTSWEACKQQVHGYAGALYKGFDSKEEAQKALLSPCWDYIGKRAKEREVATQKAAVPAEALESLSVDAACSGNPGLMEYQGVYTRTGQRVFHQGPFEDATNNVGEFLALVHGLALLKQQGSTLPVYSDSRTARAWVREKKAKTRLERTPRNAALFDLIERAERWLRDNDYPNDVRCWDTDHWGEIPADFGRK